MIHFNHLKIQMNIKFCLRQIIISFFKIFLIMMKNFLLPIFDDSFMVNFEPLAIYYAASISIMIIFEQT